jgi:protein-tyrosine phosphatase
MSHKYLLSLLGLVLIGVGLFEGGWALLVVWLGANFLAIGIAHGIGAHRVFGKRSNGTLPLWSWLAFLPLLIITIAAWHLLRLLIREPAHNSVTEQLTVGRRLLASELGQEFDNVVDLTAEFSEPAALRRSASYFNFPILDGGAPTPDNLRDAVNLLRPGKTFIHCAQGHGRTGLFALALLLKSGAARNVEDGLRMLKAARPGINLSRAQRKCIEVFARELAA